MAQFKGTPGPWRVNTIGKHWNNPALVHLEVTFGTDGECICDTVYRSEDADLIAAAPELLEALRQLRDHVEDMHAVQYGHNWDDKSHPMSLALAAINKATGEER